MLILPIRASRIIRYCEMNSRTEKFTVILNGELQLIDPTPSYTELSNRVLEAFAGLLPAKFSLYYSDADGDIITISTQSDLDVALASGACRFYTGENAQSVKQCISAFSLPSSAAGSTVLTPKFKESTAVLVNKEGKEETAKLEDVSAVKEQKEKKLEQTSAEGKGERKVVELNKLEQHQGIMCNFCEGNIVGQLYYRCMDCGSFYLCEECGRYVKHAHPLVLFPAKNEDDAPAVPMTTYKAALVEPKGIIVLEVEPKNETTMSLTFENTGKIAWPQTATLELVEGDIRTTPVAVSSVRPGERQQVKVAIKAPAAAGKYPLSFQLVFEGVVRIWPLVEAKVIVKVPRRKELVFAEVNHEIIRFRNLVAVSRIPKEQQENVANLMKVFPGSDAATVYSALKESGGNTAEAAKVLLKSPAIGTS